MVMKIWVQHDQGGGDRTCLQILRLDLLRNPGPLDRRRTWHRSNLCANVETSLTANTIASKQQIKI